MPSQTHGAPPGVHAVAFGLVTPGSGIAEPLEPPDDPPEEEPSEEGASGESSPEEDPPDGEVVSGARFWTVQATMRDEMVKNETRARIMASG